MYSQEYIPPTIDSLPDPPNLKTYTDPDSNVIWQEGLYNPDQGIISTDGSLKEKNGTKYELSGSMMVHYGTACQILVTIGGRGGSSYSAETNAILQALSIIESSPLRSFCIVTDCLILVSQIQEWKKWDKKTIT